MIPEIKWGFGSVGLHHVSSSGLVLSMVSRKMFPLSMGPDIVIQSEASSSKTVPKPNDKSLLKEERPPSPREDNTRMEPENQVVRLQAYRCQQ